MPTPPAPGNFRDEGGRRRGRGNRSFFLPPINFLGTRLNLHPLFLSVSMVCWIMASLIQIYRKKHDQQTSLSTLYRWKMYAENACSLFLVTVHFHDTNAHRIRVFVSLNFWSSKLRILTNCSRLLNDFSTTKI